VVKNGGLRLRLIGPIRSRISKRHDQGLASNTDP
jgi:hypothetical protein